MVTTHSAKPVSAARMTNARMGVKLPGPAH